jgi:hypothetical protein
MPLRRDGLLFEHGIEYRSKITGGRIDHVQHLGGRGLLLQRFVTLGPALGKLMFEIGYPLLGIG